MTPEEMAITLVIGAVYGLVFAVYGIITKKDPDEPIKPKKAVRTILLFTAAGALVAFQGNPVTPDTVQAHLADVAVVGIVFDMAWPRIRRLLEDWGVWQQLFGT